MPDWLLDLLLKHVASALINQSLKKKETHFFFHIFCETVVISFSAWLFMMDKLHFQQAATELTCMVKDSKHASFNETSVTESAWI